MNNNKETIIESLKLLSFLIKTMRIERKYTKYRVKKEIYDSKKSVYFKDDNFIDVDNTKFVKSINKAIKILNK